ncbi:hypothetical protein E2C01_064280 [Portunus trituberculatus]|uniref:Uncharacterized protein n=1 Tax=Portunus trituberculatus TaxID=210409 RepID=A0A5B7HNC1_PORTR|nr:hypothetical protein [Portunus trituberculatus]
MYTHARTHAQCGGTQVVNISVKERRVEATTCSDARNGDGEVGGGHGGHRARGTQGSQGAGNNRTSDARLTLTPNTKMATPVSI